MKSIKSTKSTKSRKASEAGAESKYYKDALASLKVNNMQKEVKGAARLLSRNKIAVI